MMIYKNTEAMVRSPDGDTNFFNIVTEVLQGNSLTSYMFIICQDKIRCRQYLVEAMKDADYKNKWSSASCKYTSRKRNLAGPVGCASKIHRLHHCREVRPPPYECSGYDTKQSDGEASEILELWGMQSTPSLPSLPSQLWPGMVAPEGSMDQIELNCVLMLN